MFKLADGLLLSLLSAAGLLGGDDGFRGRRSVALDDGHDRAKGGRVIRLRRSTRKVRDREEDNDDDGAPAKRAGGRTVMEGMTTAKASRSRTEAAPFGRGNFREK